MYGHGEHFGGGHGGPGVFGFADLAAAYLIDENGVTEAIGMRVAA